MQTKKSTNRSTISRTILIIIGILVAILLSFNSGLLSIATIQAEKSSLEKEGKSILQNEPSLSRVTSHFEKLYTITVNAVDNLK